MSSIVINVLPALNVFCWKKVQEKKRKIRKYSPQCSFHTRSSKACLSPRSSHHCKLSASLLGADRILPRVESHNGAKTKDSLDEGTWNFFFKRWSTVPALYLNFRRAMAIYPARCTCSMKKIERNRSKPEIRGKKEEERSLKNWNGTRRHIKTITSNLSVTRFQKFYSKNRSHIYVHTCMYLRVSS